MVVGDVASEVVRTAGVDEDSGTSAPPYSPPGQLALMSGSPAGKTGESQQPAGESQRLLTALPV